MATGDLYETSYVKAGRDGRRPRLCVTYHDPATGRRRERTRATEPRRASALEREAEEWRAELNREWRERAAEEERRRGNPTVAECVDRYIADRELDVRRRPGDMGDGLIERSTMMDYRKVAEYAKDPVGGLRDVGVLDLTPELARDWERALARERGLSQGTIRTARTFLKMALAETAVADGIVSGDPIGRSRRRWSREAPNALDRISVARVRAWIAEDPTDWFRCAVALALYAGMRRGECCALAWRDVDMTNGSIRVAHSLGLDEDGCYLKATKNGRARTVPVSDSLREVLRERARWTMGELEAVYGPDEARLRFPSHYVIGNVDGTWTPVWQVTANWCRKRDKIGVTGFQRERCPFHDLRHTFITYALYSGVNVLDLMPVVGHSSTAMTLDVYASSDPSMTSRMGPAIDAAYPDAPGDGGETPVDATVEALPDATAENTDDAR